MTGLVTERWCRRRVERRAREPLERLAAAHADGETQGGCGRVHGRENTTRHAIAPIADAGAGVGDRCPGHA